MRFAPVAFIGCSVTSANPYVALGGKRKGPAAEDTTTAAGLAFETWPGVGSQAANPTSISETGSSLMKDLTLAGFCS